MCSLLTLDNQWATTHNTDQADGQTVHQPAVHPGTDRSGLKRPSAYALACCMYDGGQVTTHRRATTDWVGRPSRRRPPANGSRYCFSYTATSPVFWPFAFVPVIVSVIVLPSFDTTRLA